MEVSLRRQLGLTAVAAIVAGDMLGSGVFFTPGELAAVAQQNWQVYFFWGLSGIITLCGALTLAEMSSLIPRAGSTYHIIREGFGEFWAFVKIWVEMWVSVPGSVAGVAIVFGEFLAKFLGSNWSWAPSLWGIVAVLIFAVINLMGVRWGGRTQITLTGIKILALLSLIFGSLLFAKPVGATHASPLQPSAGLSSFIRLVGLGVAIVLFTYDGWIDVTHTAGEVTNPKRNLPTGLLVGVSTIIVLYLVVNYAYLRIVPLEQMRTAPRLVATTVAVRTLGMAGERFLTCLIMISILGSLGGLVMTAPRLFFGAALHYKSQSPENPFFRAMASVSARTAVPYGSILFSTFTSILALLSFRSFSRLANFFLVSLQFVNILMVSAIFRFRKRFPQSEDHYRTPGYPVVPLVFIVVMALFLISAIYYNPKDTLIGIALTSTAIPTYLWMKRRRQS